MRWSMRFDYLYYRIFACRATNVHGHAIIQSQQLTRWPSLAVKSINWLYRVVGRLISFTSIELCLHQVTPRTYIIHGSVKWKKSFRPVVPFFRLNILKHFFCVYISGFLTIFFPQTRIYLCRSSGFFSTLEQRQLSPMKYPAYPLACLGKVLRYV